MSPTKQIESARVHLQRAQKLCERWRDTYPETAKPEEPKEATREEPEGERAAS